MYNLVFPSRYSSVLLLFLAIVACSNPPQKIDLSPAEFQDGLKADNALLLDVRTPDEWNNGFIERAVFIDFNDAGFSNALDSLPKEKVLYVYCAAGGRSASACKMLEEKGFTRVHNLSGGIKAWENAGLPIVKP